MVDGRTRTGKIVNQLKQQPARDHGENRTPIATDMYLPNHSGRAVKTDTTYLEINGLVVGDILADIKEVGISQFQIYTIFGFPVIVSPLNAGAIGQKNLGAYIIWGSNIFEYIATTHKFNGIISVKDGSNQISGTATLVGGTVTVSNTKVTATSKIFLTAQNNTGGANGTLFIRSRTPGQDFTINSIDAADASDVAWWIIEGY